ncbi:precorrin-2 C20-methyltransferase [Alkalispirochaeta odontotermitis]|nr:precorrin-2 C20-methyltransferase [Alkalispirochaeta odontotermitis]CAB1077784.1 Cobalt-precorrin-2 C(20)-methyltransferase (EC [Olavius algarvensis Delta 1 endosymbiont]
MTKTAGILYGIGVGPGDPDLITVKAAKILNRVDTVFAAASTKNNHSLAVNIAGEHIPERTAVKMLRFPMTSDKDETRQAWKANARTVIAELETGRNAAFLTLGDSMTYSTYGYILKYVQSLAPHLEVQTVPGITSYQAAAARLNTPLVEGEESLMVVSGVTGGNRLRELHGIPENVVFLKAYRNVPDIKAAIDETGTYANCVGVKNCSQSSEIIINDMEELSHMKPDYWTLIISKQASKNGQPKG